MKTGFVTFRTQAESENYLRLLPIGVNARSYKTESGKWAVAYRTVNQ